MKNILLINDTTIDLHYGCQLVISNIELLCKKNNLNIIERIFLRDKEGNRKIDNYIDKINIVIINGEGTIHHNSNEGKKILKYAEKIKEKNKNIKIYLINSTIESIDEYIGLLTNIDEIFVREKYSSNYLSNHGILSTVMGDLTLYGNIEKNFNTSNSLLGIGGSVNPKLNNILYIFSKKHIFLEIAFFKSYGILYKIFGSKIHFLESIFNFKRGNIKTYIKNIKNLNFFITGRFHDVCLAIKYKIPFYYINSNSFKIQSLIETIGIEKRHINISELNNNKLKYPQFSDNEIKKINTFIKEKNELINNLFMKIGTE